MQNGLIDLGCDGSRSTQNVSVGLERVDSLNRVLDQRSSICSAGSEESKAGLVTHVDVGSCLVKTNVVEAIGDEEEKRKEERTLLLMLEDDEG
jgi:hypothetical protein